MAVVQNDFDQIRVRDLVFFDRLAALASITNTARELGVPKATASRWLAQLEERVGQSLVRRTTRQVALTENGLAFHAHVRTLLSSLRAAQLAVRAPEPAGILRVSVPVPLGRIVGGPVIAAFRRAMPHVRLEIVLDNRRVDLIRDAFDLAIRGGPLPDSELVLRRLATVSMWLYASSEFRDTQPSELAMIGMPGDEALLRRRRPDLPPPVVVVDDRSAIAEALMHGAGAGLLPGFLGEPARRQHHLVRLQEEPLASMHVHAIYLSAQRADPRLKVLIATIERELEATLSS